MEIPSEFSRGVAIPRRFEKPNTPRTNMKEYLASSNSATISPKQKLSSREKNQGANMATLYTSDAENFEYDDRVISEADAREYAAQVAKEAIEAYAAHTTNTTKEVQMANTEITDAAEAVKQETLLSAKLVSGEILLNNITTLAENLILSRLPFWKRWMIKSNDKELLVAAAMYTLLTAAKTGAFGLTKYRINHAAIEYVTVAANKKILSALVAKTGVNFNVAQALFAMPELTSVEG